MGQRTTITAVQNLLDSNYDMVTDLQQFIDSASNVVNQVATYATGMNRGLSNTTLELVERWLACHLYAQVDMLYQSKSTGGASASFQGQTEMNIGSTRYGQTAMNIDTSGALTAISKRSFAYGFWLGKPPSQQIPYNQRN